MEEKYINLSVNLTEKSFTLSAAEDIFEVYLDKIIKLFSTYSSIDSIPTTKITTSTELTAKNHNHLKTYIDSGVIHIDEEADHFRILKRIPGNSIAEKAKNVVMIYLFIRNIKTTSKELISIVKEYDLFDSGHFSDTFNRDTYNFYRKGDGQSWSLELTVNGKISAKKLLEDLVNAAK